MHPVHESHYQEEKLCHFQNLPGCSRHGTLTAAMDCLSQNGLSQNGYEQGEVHFETLWMLRPMSFKNFRFLSRDKTNKNFTLLTTPLSMFVVLWSAVY